MKPGMPAQGKKTPRTTRRERRTRSAVRLKIEMGLWEVEEERGDIGYGSVNGL
jgi:hypothetical protein